MFLHCFFLFYFVVSVFIFIFAARNQKRIEYDSSSKETIGNTYGTIFKFATGDESRRKENRDHVLDRIFG